MGWTENIVKQYDIKGYKIIDNLVNYFDENIKNKLQQKQIDIELLPNFLVKKLNLDKEYYGKNKNSDKKYDFDDIYPDITLQYDYKVLEKDGKKYWEVIHSMEYFNGNSVEYYIELLPEDKVITKNKDGFYQWTPYILQYKIIDFINDTIWGNKDIFGDIGQGKGSRTIKDKNIAEDYLNNLDLSIEEKKYIIDNILSCYIENSGGYNINKISENKQIKDILEDLEQSEYIDGIICPYCSALIYPEYVVWKNNTLIVSTICPNCGKKIEKKIDFNF